MQRAQGGFGRRAVIVACAAVGCASPAREEAVDGGAVTTATAPVVRSVDARADLAGLRARFASALGAGPARLSPRADRLSVEVAAKVARPAHVSLPARADRAVQVADEGSQVAIAFTLRGAGAVDAALADGLAIYPRALGDAALVHRPHAEGTEDFVAFATRPARAELVYDVDVSRAAGVRLIGDQLELLDASGTPRLRVAPPYVLDAHGARRPATLSLEGCAFDADPRAPWDRPVTPAGASSCALHVRWGELDYPALVDPSWTTTGSLSGPRTGHALVKLASGKALVVGGGGGSGALSTAELFDGTSAFAATGAMAQMRSSHVAALLADGRVLVAGGGSGAGTGGTALASATAETYDPTTGKFTATTGPMASPRSSAVAVPLATGKVLVVGGWNGASTTWSTAELFDPTAGTFTTTTKSMLSGRQNHQAVRLASGKVLIVGGMSSIYLSTADLYDPTSGAFTPTDNMSRVRRWPRPVVLADGRVLVVGGDDSGGNQASADLYDPTKGTFAATGPMTAGRLRPEALLLADGHVLVAGGYFGGASISTSEIYDPATATFAAIGALIASREAHKLVLGAGNAAFAIGGNDGNGGVLSSAERLSFAADGATCVAKDDCLSGLCAGGHCCKSSCAAPSGCQAASSCDATGACTYATQPAGTSCGTSGFVCSGASTACPTTCAGDAQCDASHYCAGNGTCQPIKARGAVCVATSDCKVAGCRECGAGSCVGGVCCEAGCTGTCRACTKALTGVTDGTCADVLAGLAGPNGKCATTAQSSCGTDGLCDGNGACRRYGVTTSCGTASCPNDTTAQGQFCDGKGVCGATGATKTCDAGYKCAAGVGCKSNCQTSADCTSGYVCVAGACVLQLDNGQPCVDATICKSGQCVDGVCCNSACAGQCEACDVTGSVGTCSAAQGTPHGTRAACDAGSATDACTAKTCDGLGRTACAYVGSDVVCAPAGCTAGVASSVGTCGGGACNVAKSACGAFACAGASCGTTCASDLDCADKFTCDTSKHDCVAKQGPVCSTDGLSVVDPAGGTASCAPYVCAGGQCKGRCDATTDCQSAFVCDTESNKCVAAPTSSDSGGCGVAPPSRGGWGALVLVAGACLLGRRRRLRRRMGA